MAHPVRLRLLELLRASGPSRVSELAVLLNESSASTSYHLQQLYLNGLIQDRPDLARDRRERWWQAADVISWPSSKVSGATDLDALLLTQQASRAQAFLDRREDAYDEAWQEAATFGTYQLQLSPEQLRAFHADFLALYQRYHDRGQDSLAADSQPVLVFLNAFPVQEPEDE